MKNKNNNNDENTYEKLCNDIDEFINSLPDDDDNGIRRRSIIEEEVGRNYNFGDDNFAYYNDNIPKYDHSNDISSSNNNDERKFNNDFISATTTTTTTSIVGNNKDLDNNTKKKIYEYETYSEEQYPDDELDPTTIQEENE